jgi:hypothetical protein
MQGSKVMRQSRAGTLAPEEPDELIAHVRVCGGAGWVTTGSTRKPTPNSFRSYVASAIGRTAGVGQLYESLDFGKSRQTKSGT